MVIPIMDFWLPIVLATVLCFVAGAVLHMMVPLHKGDWKKLPHEDGLIAAMGKAGLQPGNYMFPHMSTPEIMKDPAFSAKLEQGPCGIMTVRPPGGINMGPYLTKQFIYHLLGDNQEVGLEAAILERKRNSSLVKRLWADNPTGLKHAAEAAAFRINPGGVGVHSVPSAVPYCKDRWSARKRLRRHK